MSMTKKDLTAIAAALASQIATGQRLLADAREKNLPNAVNIWEGHVSGLIVAAEVLATVAAESNPRFDRARFLAACAAQE
jgi:hypothetical protein